MYYYPSLQFVASVGASSSKLAQQIIATASDSARSVAILFLEVMVFWGRLFVPGIPSVVSVSGSLGSLSLWGFLVVLRA